MSLQPFRSIRWQADSVRGLSIFMLLMTLLMTGRWVVQAQQSQPVNFGDQGPIQFVDPDGLNQIYFTYSTQPTGQPLDFKLYGVDGERFAQLTAELSANVPDTTGLVEAAAWSVAPNQEQFSIQSTTVPTVPSGTYLLVANEAGSSVKSGALITVSRVALVLKADANGRLTAWASTLRSGEAIAAMNVTVYAQDGSVLGSATTDANGVATIETGSPLNLNAWPFETIVAVASGAGEVTTAGTGYLWRNYNYGYYGGNASRYSTYLYTERPLYKPGDAISFKAIVRRSAAGSLVVPAGETVKLKLQDSRGDEVDTMELTVDEFGTVSGQFTLSDGVPLGSYQLFATLGAGDGAETFQQELKVEEYRKPEYSVTVSGSEAYGIAGQAMDVTVDSQYFFGQPVANANVTLQIFESSYGWYRPWWEWGYYDYAPSPSNNLVGEFSGKTDANGRFVQAFTPQSSADYTTSYRFAAKVTDAQGQPIDGSLSLPVYWNTFAMNLSTGKYGYQSGETVTIDVDLKQHNGTPVAGKQVTLTISGDTWDGTTTVPNIVRQGLTDDAGQVQVTLDNLPQGWYRVRATTVDDLERKLETYNYIWIFETNANSWWYFNDDDLTVTTDKESYEVGDTAQLLIQSRITDTLALVTLERESVLDEIVVALDGPVTTVNVPITEQLSPNVVVMVHLYKPTAASAGGSGSTPEYGYQAPIEAELVVGRTELVVPVSHKRLVVAIESNAGKYLPGDQATIQLKVTDNNGQPVRAQVSLALVDEALYALQADLSGDLFEAFYRRRGSSIGTYQSTIRPSLYTYLYGPPMADSPDLELAAPTPEADPASRDDTGADIALREEFLDTAYWNPNIVTDANGNATINVDLPDNLTTWRIVAKAVTVDTQVGEGDNTLLVTQELIARPALPRFSVLGDRFQVGAVGQNYTGQDLTGTIDMSCSNLLLLDNGPRSLTLANNGSDVAYWTAVASQIGTGTVTTTLLAGNGGDKIALPMEVKPFAVPERQAFSTVVTALQPTVKQAFEVPLNAVNDASSATINLSPSLAMSLLDDLDTLINYPYGCVEQTMSRLMPSAAASIVYKQLGIPNPKEAELEAIMTQGINLLRDMQTGEGGWTWYGAGEVNQHISAYVMFGLTLVKEAGFDVPESLLTSGFGYLTNVLPTVEDKDVRTYILYVQSRADRGDLNALKALLPSINQLDSFSLGILAQALHKEGATSDANSVLDLLLTRVRQTATDAYIPADATLDWYHWQSMASDEKNTAAAISALSSLDPTNELLPKMVRWLLNQRQGSNYYSGAGWKDTHATASAVLGLLDYIQVSRETEANYSYTVLLNGTAVGSGQVTPQNFTQPIAPLVIPGDQLRFGTNELTISRTDGNGSLYATGALRLQLFYSEFEAVTEAAQGLSVRRAYYMPDSRTPIRPTNVKMGDLIDVEVVVGNETEMSYVLVSSPIPAGFEVIDDGVGTSPYGYGDWFWFDYSYSYKDIRTDRVDFFAPQLYQGEHVYRYKLRAVTPGEFSTLPAEAYPMYKEELWGRSASEQFLIMPELLVDRPVLSGDMDNDCRVSQFDAQQIAAAWGTSSASADVSGGDGKIDLRDVAQVAGRIGANCLVDAASPGTSSGKTTLSMTMNQTEAGLAQTFTADIIIVEGTDVGGLELTLNYDANELRFDSVEWHGDFADALPLGPTTDGQSGQVRFGAFDTKIDGVTGASAGTKVATVIFRGLRSGEAALQLQAVRSTNGSAQLVETDVVDGDGSIILDGTTVFMPVVQ